MVEFEVEFGYPGPKSPPSTLVDNILKTYKASLEFTATIPSSGKNFRNLLCKFLMFYCIITVIISKYCMKKLTFLTFLDMKRVSLGSIDWGCKSPRPKNANLKSQYDYAKKK